MKKFFFYFLVFFLIGLIFEGISFFLLKNNKYIINHKIRDEYRQLLTHSNIKETELIDHFLTLNRLSQKHNGLREYHPGSIYIYKRNLSAETFETNSLGLPDEEPKTGREKIILLGSSVVGGGLRRNKIEDIDKYLEYKISKKLRKNIQVINAGIGGYESTQEFNLFHTLIYDLDNVSKVIYFSGANDVLVKYLLRNQNDLSNYDTQHSKIVEHILEKNKKKNTNIFYNLINFSKENIFQALFSYKLLAEIIHEMKIKNKKNYSEKNSIKQTEIKLTEKDTKLIKFLSEKYISNVEKMFLLASPKRVDFYVGVQPVLFQKGNKTPFELQREKYVNAKYGQKLSLYFEKSYDLMEEGLRQLSNKYDGKIKILNTRYIFNDDSRDIFRDNVHFLDYANEIVAEKFFLEIRN